MNIDNFKIEDWINEHCENAKYDLSTTCIKLLKINELKKLCTNYSEEIFDVPLDYGELQGSIRLKKAIQSTYRCQEIENIIITHGGIGANQLVIESIISPEDEVISIVPAYQQYYAIPKSLGASIKLLFTKEDNNWLPELKELESLITDKTKLITLNNPNNPTGAVISDEMLKDIVKIAQKHDIWILSDEAYRGLNLFGNNFSEAIADLYQKGISTGSMSKTYSLAGLRVGHICTQDKTLINSIITHRKYNTISISLLDDYFSALALENKEKIIERNLKILKENYKILKDWSENEPLVKVKLPQGGTTVLIKYLKDMPSRQFCEELQNATGIALIPGETFEIDGYVRLGYSTKKETLEIALKLISEFLHK